MKKQIGLLLCASMCIITFTKAQDNTMAYDAVKISGTAGNGDDAKVIRYERDANGNILHIYEIGLFGAGGATPTCSFPQFPTTAASLGGEDIYMIRYSPTWAAQMLWTWGTTNNDIPFCAEVVPNSNGTDYDVYIGGSYNSGSILLMRVAQANVPTTFVTGAALSTVVVTATAPGAGTLRCMTYDGCALYVGGGFTTSATFNTTVLTTTGILSTFVANFKLNTQTYFTALQPAAFSADNEAYGMTWGGPYDPYSVFITGYFKTGITFGGAAMTSSGTRDVYITSFQIIPPCPGALSWTTGTNCQRKAGTSHTEVGGDYGADIGWGIADDRTTSSSNLYITGAVGGSSVTATFDSHTFTTSPATSTTLDRTMFVAGYVMSGSGQIAANSWVENISSTSNLFSVGCAVATDHLGNLFVTGQAWTNSTVVGSGSTSVNLTGDPTSPINAGFVARYVGSNGNLCWADRILRNTCNTDENVAAYSIDYAECKLAFAGSYDGNSGNSLYFGNMAPFAHIPIGGGNSDDFTCEVAADLTIPYGNNIPSLSAYLNSGSVTVPFNAVSCTATTWSWSPTTYLSSSSINNPSATFTSTGTTTYTVTGTVSGGCTYSGSFSITIKSGTGYAGADVGCCSPWQVSIGAAAQTGFTYSWIPPVGCTVSNYTTTPTTSNGVGTYTLITVDNCGNKQYDEVAVSNCCHCNRLADPNASLDPSSDGAISLFPNPSDGNFNLNVDLDGEKEISVTDIAGKIIYKKISSEKIIAIDMTDRANGMYFVKINVNGEQYIRRIVKE